MHIHPVRLVGLLVSVALSLFFSFTIGTVISERYFFDQVYYQKSPRFGYAGTEAENERLTKERVNGLTLLSGLPQAEGKYTIVVIGDSLVWGMGVKKQDRFAQLLEAKLSKRRPTAVYSFGKPGDNFLDHLSKTVLLEKAAPPDLYVFIVFINDILLWDTVRYPTVIQEEITANCNKLGSYVYDGKFLEPVASMDDYNDQVSRAWKNPANLCLISEGAKLLPHNAIYLIVDNHSETHEYDRYTEILREAGLTVESLSRTSAGIETYGRYFDNPQKYFSVSVKEAHPSALANRMIADYLFTEITSSKAWGFDISE